MVSPGIGDTPAGRVRLAGAGGTRLHRWPDSRVGKRIARPSGHGPATDTQPRRAVECEDRQASHRDKVVVLLQAAPNFPERPIIDIHRITRLDCNRCDRADHTEPNVGTTRSQDGRRRANHVVPQIDFDEFRWGPRVATEGIVAAWSPSFRTETQEPIPQALSTMNMATTTGMRLTPRPDH